MKRSYLVYAKFMDFGIIYHEIFAFRMDMDVGWKLLALKTKAIGACKLS